MIITRDRQKTEARSLALKKYLTTHVLGAHFICPHFHECKSSHAEKYYEGQLHHLGRFYDLLFDDLPLRVVIVGQEYGKGPAHVGLERRYDMIMNSGLKKRFEASGGYEARNSHMKGTTNVLRLLFGIPLGTDHETEFLTIGNEHVHLFDAFALVNYLLCSAVPNEGSMRGKATRTMKKNCAIHFREVIRILEPSVVIVQGKGFWKTIKTVFDSVKQEADYVFHARIGTTETLVAALTHPSARFPNNWGINERTPYLLETVAPTIARIREHLRGR